MQIAKQDIVDQINTLLGDNTTRDITPQRLRDVFGSVLDSYVHKDEVTAGGSSAMRFIQLSDIDLTVLNEGTIPVGSSAVLSNITLGDAEAEIASATTFNGIDVIGANVLRVLPGQALWVQQISITEIIIHKFFDYKII